MTNLLLSRGVDSHLAIFENSLDDASCVVIHRPELDHFLQTFETIKKTNNKLEEEEEEVVVVRWWAVLVVPMRLRDELYIDLQ